MSNSKKLCLVSCIALLILFGIRAFSLGVMPLVDPSESRYALIAKKMVDSGDYLIPKLTNHAGTDEAFWGKPPLFFWSVAGSYRLLGGGETASRIPSFCAMLLAVLGTFLLARKCYSTTVAWTSALLLSTSGLFFVYGGLCQVDMLLTAALVWAYLGFRFAIESEGFHKAFYILLFAFSVAAGFLTKGPLILALLFLGLGCWLYRVRKTFSVALQFPFFSAALLTLALISPWYILAERASPGLLKYFFLNENLLRFFVKSYGDKYGFSHSYPMGTVWVFLLLGTMPWGFFALSPGFWREMKLGHGRDHFRWLFIIWGLSPAVLFTFSHHVLLSYVLPGLPGICIAVAVFVHTQSTTKFTEYLSRSTLPVALVFGLISVTSIGLVFSRLGYSVLPEYNVAFAQAIAGLAALAFFLHLLKRTWNPRGVLAILTGITLFVVSSSAAIIAASAVPAAAFQPYLIERFPASKYELNFPFGIPYSAYVYLPHELESAPEEINLPEHEEVLKEEALLVPANKIKQFETALFQSSQPFRFVSDLGSWKVYERCRPEESDNLRENTASGK